MNCWCVQPTDRGADVCACFGCAQIIAGLAGVKCFPVQECEKMYDNLINKIFIKHPGGGMKLALKQVRESDEHFLLSVVFLFSCPQWLQQYGFNETQPENERRN